MALTQRESKVRAFEYADRVRVRRTSRSRDRKSISEKTTETNVYVRTKQKEFDYPQGETNSYTSYEGSGGITYRQRTASLDSGLCVG